MSDLDPNQARSAFETFKPRLEALSPREGVAVNLDLRRASVTAASVGRFVLEPPNRARFARLPAQEFEQRHIQDLQPAALTLWHCTLQLATASSGASEAKIPQHLLEIADELKPRMLKLAEYYLSDHPEDRDEVADIRKGTGHMDTLMDLPRLVVLHEKHHETFKHDRKYYRPTDREDALTLSNKIFTVLGETHNQNQKAWQDTTTRAWAVLLAIYDEVSAAGKWLFRHENPNEKFPSLYTAGRANRRRAPRSGSAPDAGQNSDSQQV